jgi:hypothetical protein
MNKKKSKTIVIYLLLASFSFAGDSIASRFIPKDSIQYLEPFPDSTSILTVTKKILMIQGKLKNDKESEYKARIRSNYEIHLKGTLLILKYNIEDKIIKDSLLGYKASLDTILKLLNEIPNGRFIKGTLDPSEVIIQTKTKYISCVECLFRSKGKNEDKLRRIFEILRNIQEKAYKKNR